MGDCGRDIIVASAPQRSAHVSVTPVQHTPGACSSTYLRRERPDEGGGLADRAAICAVRARLIPGTASCAAGRGRTGSSRSAAVASLRASVRGQR